MKEHVTRGRLAARRLERRVPGQACDIGPNEVRTPEASSCRSHSMQRTSYGRSTPRSSSHDRMPLFAGQIDLAGARSTSLEPDRPRWS